MLSLYESEVEEWVIELLQEQGYTYLSPEEQERTRGDFSEVVCRERLRDAVTRLNPDIPEDEREYALREVLGLSSQSMIENNETFHRYLTEGFPVEYQKEGDTVGGKVVLVDFENPMNNNLIVCNQYTVAGNRNKTKIRPDVVLLINGLPLVVIELKNPTDEKATVKKAYTQLQNYKKAAPSLFYYNGVLVASDGLDARAGSLTAGMDRFMAWKTVDGVREDKSTIPQVETLIKGMLRPDVLFDLIKQFTVFEKSQAETSKKIAAYHQYYAVCKAVESTIRATATGVSEARKEAPEDSDLPMVNTQPAVDRKVGVVWHTQGSGKSLSMVFYAGKLMGDARMKNPTLLVLTDRNDLDDQLFGAFAASRQLLIEEPVQAQSRDHLKRLLQTQGGGIVFTTIQKFSPEEDREQFELLSGRENIVVIADEAHRSQYGFKAITGIKDNRVSIRYGFAKYLRDALPSASFIGFTGTPIEGADISTPAIFGDYIDIYDIQQSVEDGATIPIYYASRLAHVHLKPEEMQKLDDEVEQITEDQEFTATEKAKAKWAQMEAIVGNEERLKVVAQDIVEHFEERQKALEGKGIIVAMSRRIAVALYDEITKLCPDWHDIDLEKGQIKVIMTSNSSDPSSYQPHRTTKRQKKELGDRFKDSTDSLKLVIVRDMWLTGFDAPSLHTMYIDKPMRGHNLMQAIARVNRVYKNKPGGLVVDYIGIAHDLKQALAIYTNSGGRGKPALEQETAIATMMEKYEIVVQLFNGFDYKRYFAADTGRKLTIILEAQEHILNLDDGKKRYIEQVSVLAKTFALSVPSDEAAKIRDELGFFEAVKARLIKLESSDNGKSDAEIETAIKQIVDKAIMTDEVIDIFDAAGIKKPDISILSDEFLEEVRGMQHKNLAIELLKKILNDEIKARIKKNFIQGRKLSEMLDAVIKRYRNNLLTTAQVIGELVSLAKEITDANKRGERYGLSQEELAFYDALADNDSAKRVLGDDTLRDIARILVEKVKKGATIDWTVRESVQAGLRVAVKGVLRKYGYPPDKQEIATHNVLKQAESFADEWASDL